MSNTEDRFRHLWRSHLANMPGCNFKVTEHPLTATFTHPGLTYTSFDRDGANFLFSVLSLVVEVRLFAEYYPYKENEKRWFSWHDILKDYAIFMSSTDYVLSEKMHNKNVPKWPVLAKVYLRYVGSSSLAISVELYIPGDDQPLLTHNVQMVVVDPVTRKPKPFPDWFISKYKDQCLSASGFRLQMFPRPENTFVYRREVMFQDTDSNNHTNYASYIRYALDGLYAALKQQSQGEATRGNSNRHESSSETLGTKNCVSSSRVSNSSANVLLVEDANKAIMKLQAEPPVVLHTKNSAGGLKGITRDIVQRGVKAVRVCYVNESVEGDIIDIHVWQEDHEAYIVRSSVESGGKIICQIIFEYFDPVSKL